MSVHAFGEFELDRSLYELRQAGNPIEVGPRLFDVLAYLIDHRDRLVSKEELIREVWDATAMSESSVPTCIAAIRKVLGDDPASAEFIETHRGRGYRFIAPVTKTARRSEISFVHDDPERQQRSMDIGRSIFVGRENELSSLYAAFERALAGNPQLVLVAGDAGIGKTRILEELAPTVRNDGATVLHGRCIEGGGAPAFWPWVQIVRAYTDTPGLPSIPQALGALASSLLRMIPELADRFPEVPTETTADSEQARFRLYDAVTLLLTRAAAERPIVLLIDDLHRADTASLLLLRFAAREMRDAPILIVGTYRDLELQSDNLRSEIITDLAREEPTRCIQLSGLTVEAVKRLLAESTSSGEPPESLSIAMHEQTAGNPFFVTQIIHLLAADSQLDQNDMEAEWSSRLPSGIREAITRQLDGLPAETVRTVSVAAVAGREFSIQIIAPAMSQTPEATLDSLQPALDSRLITPIPGEIDRYRFAHVLLRDCVYDGLPAKDRVACHHLIGESLETLHESDLASHAAELAFHFAEAIPTTSPKKAIDFSIRAAEWATARLAFEDAPGHYRRILNLFDKTSCSLDISKGELLLSLGTAEFKAGARDRARTTLISASQVARASDQPHLLARVALALAPDFFALEVGVFDHELVSLLEEALAALPTRDSSLRARVLGRLAIALIWSDADRRRLELSREAVSMSTRIDDPASLARALSAYHDSLWGPSDFNARLQTATSIAGPATKTRDRVSTLMHHLFRATAFLESAQIDDADHEIDAFATIARPTRQKQYLWYVDLLAATRALLNGEFREAEPISRRFFQAGSSVKDANAIQSFAVHIAIIRWEQRRAREVLPFVDHFITRYPAVTAWRCVRMFLNLDLGNVAEASIELENLSRSNFRAVANNTNRLVSLCLLAEVAAGVKSLPIAERLYDRLIGERDHNAIIGYSTGFFGSVEDRLGLIAAALGDHRGATGHFEKAIQTHTEMGASPWLARSKFLLAREVLQKGNPAEVQLGRELLAEARAAAEAMGMNNLQAKIAHAFPRD